MIIERITWTAKVGQKDELVKFAKDFRERHNGTGRTCTFEFGDKSKVWNEFEFETLEYREKFWADLVWSPADEEDMKNLMDNLQESVYTREIIRVH